MEGTLPVWPIHQADRSSTCLSGLLATCFPTTSTREPTKTPERASVVGAGANPGPPFDEGQASLWLECYLRMEQTCSFPRLAIISKSNISRRTINGVFRKSLCIPTILKIYVFCGTKIQLATLVSIIACPALWECLLSVAAFLLLLSLLFSPPAPETAAWLTHHRPRH